jgi:hypothetical protein
MDRDYLDVPTQYCIMDIWDPACLFSTFFGLIHIDAREWNVKKVSLRYLFGRHRRHRVDTNLPMRVEQKS